MRKKLIAMVLVGAVVLTGLVGCGKKEEKKELTVSIAASLQKPMEDIGAKFLEEKGVKVNYNVGGSGTLKKQIDKGATADIFFSANPKYVNQLVESGLTVKDDVYDMLRNSLVLIGGKDVKEKITSLEDLKDIKGKIGIGDVNTVPAGQYAKQSLEHVKLWDVLKDRMIFGKNVTTVKGYVEKGEVPFGFVYNTDALSMKDSNILYNIPNDYHNQIKYELCILKDSSDKELSKEFVDYLKSEKATKIFKDYGFGVA